MREGRESGKMPDEERRYKMLYRVTEKFHSSMNKGSVLEEIISALREVYPDFTYFLFLSQDHKDYTDLPIKSLDFTSENVVLMQSYVSGTIAFETKVKERTSILYAPLKGKQGVYGVLQVIAQDTLEFPKNEVEFISLLAATAGGAIENAQLFEQSKQLISDLQLMNEISRYLNTHFNLVDTMNYLTKQIVSSLGAEESAFILCSSENGKYLVQQGSTSFFFTKEAHMYIEYFMEKIIEANEAVFVSDLAESCASGGLPHRSAMAVPMQNTEVLKGFAIALRRQPYAFSFDTFKLYVSLIQHSTLAFTNIILREELEKMVITDYLTKLKSRNYLDQKIKASMEEDNCGTFIIIDIDDFKKINDTYGHQVGDEVIIQVADIIRSTIRNTDIGARWGGEELAVYMPRASVEIGRQVATMLVKKVRESARPAVTISCGLSFWKQAREDTSLSLFKRADKALYKAKTTGKNKVVVWEKPE